MESASTYGKNRQVGFYIVVTLLLVLCIPVSIDKLIDFATFKRGILNQPFSNDLGITLIYALPALEFLTVFGLIFARFRKIGLILSTVLMAAFTGYIVVAFLGAWEQLPCGCGSVISGMTWTQHFFFNLFFLALSVMGLYLWYRLGSSIAGRTLYRLGCGQGIIEKSCHEIL